MFNLLFSFKGRINRGQFWLAGIGTYMSTVILGFIAIALFAVWRGGMVTGSIAILAALAVVFVIAIGNVWSTAAVCTKRLHDRNKSMVWLLAIYGPLMAFAFLTSFVGWSSQGDSAASTSQLNKMLSIIIALAILISQSWLVIELGFMPGTNGPNRFDEGYVSGFFQDEMTSNWDGIGSDSKVKGTTGMEAALAAINKAASQNDHNQRPKQAEQTGTFPQHPHTQFGRRNAGATSGGFGRKV